MSQQNKDQDFHFKEFSNLDASPDADYLIHSMDIMMSLESIQGIKRRAIDAMHLQMGDTVLEIGCGHGEDAEMMGRLVGKKGSVVAIDVSQRMVREAKRRSQQANVSYLVRDICQLPYPDHSFSACHADRFLVSHNTIKESLKNILRLIKPGGIICFTDVDALSIVLFPYDRVTQIILTELQAGFVNPYVGRMLPEILIDQGLQDIVILPETSIVRSFETLKKIFKFDAIAEGAVRKGLLTSLDVKQWFEAVSQAEERGSFLYCITFFTVLGRKPF